MTDASAAQRLSVTRGVRLVLEAVPRAVTRARRNPPPESVALFGLVAYFALIFVGINWWGWRIPS